MVLYGYVSDVNGWLDVLGLTGSKDIPWHHLIPQEMLQDVNFMKELDALTTRNSGKLAGKNNGKKYIDRQGALVERNLHKKIHDGPGGGKWNSQFKDWYTDLRVNKQPLTLEGIQAQLKKMMVEHNIPLSSRNDARQYNRKDRSKKTHERRHKKKKHH